MVSYQYSFTVYNFIVLSYFFTAESVSRMIADLPPKRVTRRLVFEAPNGNNQATINSVSKILSIKKKICRQCIIMIDRSLLVFSISICN